MFGSTHRRDHYLVLTGIALVMTFWNLGLASLWDLDEGRNVQCAYEMFLAGDWVVPTCNNVLRSDKPVLLYWLQIIAYHLIGVNEWAGRLPSALAGLGTLFVVYEIARRMFSKSTALLAGIVLATTPMFVAASRFANPDALLSAFSTLTLYAFWRCQERPMSRWFVLAGAASGLAVLAKGPIGVVLPGTAIVDHLSRLGRLALDAARSPDDVGDRRLSPRRRRRWHVLVGVETHWVFLKEFLLKHHLERAHRSLWKGITARSSTTRSS